MIFCSLNSLLGRKLYQEGEIPIVNNHKKPILIPGVSNKLNLEAVFSIGGSKSESKYYFQNILTIRVDDQENIYVLDGKANEIKVFDKTGVYQRSFGRRGQGPGEFEHANGMQITSDGELLVSSFGAINYFSLNGDFIRRKNILFWGIPVIDSEGNIICETTAPVKDRPNLMVSELKKFDRSLKPLFTIAKIETIFDPNIVEYYPPTLFYTVLKNDWVVWGNDSQYELTILDRAGKIVEKIRKESEPIELSAKEKDEIKKSKKPDLTYKIPDKYPAFQYISHDENNRILVRTFETDRAADRFYDVFLPDGRYISKIILDSHPTFWKKGKLYCVKEDEQGYQWVKVYKANWQ